MENDLVVGKPPMPNTIMYILKGDNLKRLDSIFRFSGAPIIKSETISQHQWWVTMFTRILCDEMIVKDELLNYSAFALEVVSYAMFSDTGEAYSGDVIYTVKYNKYNGPEIRKALDLFVEKKMEEELGHDSLIREYSLDPEEICIKNICKVADWLALLKQLVVEHSLGNSNLEKVFDTTFKQLEIQIDNCEKNIIKKFGEKAVNKNFIFQLRKQLYDFERTRTKK